MSGHFTKSKASRKPPQLWSGSDGLARVDVLILGGGPAGTATALSLKATNPALSVVIVERSTFDQPRIGESVPPVIRTPLEQLGVWDRFLQDGHLPSYGVCSAWGDADLSDNEFIFQTQGQGWHLDRVRFDQMLAHEAEARGSRGADGDFEVVVEARTGRSGPLAGRTGTCHRDRKDTSRRALDRRCHWRRAWFARKQGVHVHLSSIA